MSPLGELTFLELASKEPTHVAGVATVLIVGAVAVVEAVHLLTLLCSSGGADHSLVEGIDLRRRPDLISILCHIFVCCSSFGE